MEKFAVIGHPIGHTMSPFIHKSLFNINGIDVEYSAIDIPPCALSEEFNGKLLDLKGFNVTIPHKESIIPLLDGIDDSATKYNAVNCVKHENGKFYGCSTDAYGFKKSLESNDISLKGNILILGAGGAAATLAREAVDNGGCVTIAARESGINKALALGERLQTLSKDVHVTTLDNINGTFDLCVNATPVGMYPNTGISAVGHEVLANCSAVFDAVYNPTQTEFMKIAESLGLKIIGGMEMLVWQAVKAHEFWYGGTFMECDVKEIIETAKIEMERIFHAK